MERALNICQGKTALTTSRGIPIRLIAKDFEECSNHRIYPENIGMILLWFILRRVWLNQKCIFLLELIVLGLWKILRGCVGCYLFSTLHSFTNNQNITCLSLFSIQMKPFQSFSNRTQVYYLPGFGPLPFLPHSNCKDNIFFRTDSRGRDPRMDAFKISILASSNYGSKFIHHIIDHIFLHSVEFCLE